MPDDRGERDLLGWPGQTIPTGHAAFALDHAGGFQIVEDLFQEPLGNVLLAGNGLNP